ncbi:hypothetical protein [Methanosarcina mazei]|uniref:Uncharacterized protein n=1 Tax=Methanosarcina mazei TaxID=2209 RepID=A0A0F8U1B6_METMZ|nr:hypothetical protein [Methanosarcina mazei]KKG07029.1 hypothetical protein DU47_04285 [Methanosarcina mazei]KKG57357.1 hypothetical protein DU33_15425 [Methanosarcina mazei]KKG60912.1 hypothetical protein DU45_15730 [Methanosarcina mazei]KKG64074.1 hypothetical protein DU64_14815 [Methanosarcina mazei]KKH91384.1 hypothetical protein DU80_11590 [Methanosarcina mazei]
MKLLELKDEDIERLLEDRLRFIGQGNDIYSRYSAYDYCYNCFRYFHEVLEREKRELKPFEKNILSLQLGLFLGTWGMFRNSNLQNCSYKIYEPLIETIFEEKGLWDIDVKDYCKNGTWKAIDNFKGNMEKALPFSVTDTLVTKIMMVVFGCVPAYDRNFRETVVPMTFNEDSLKYIYEFYQEKKGFLNQKQKELKTVSVKGGLTDYTYTMAKIIDVIGFHVTEESDVNKMKQEDPEKWDKREKQKKEKEQKLNQWLEKPNKS